MRYSSVAKHQLAALAEWWDEQRPAALPLFDLVDRAVRRLQLAPSSRAVYARRGSREVRRVRVATTPYHLYYVVVDDGLLIVAAWSGQRGSGPPIDLDALE